MSERERRQYLLMQDKINEFQANKISIGAVVDSLRSLLDNVPEAPPEWRENFMRDWWTLEQVYAFELDQGDPDNLSEEATSMFDEGIQCLKALVEQALRDVQREPNGDE